MQAVERAPNASSRSPRPSHHQRGLPRPLPLMMRRHVTNGAMILLLCTMPASTSAESVDAMVLRAETALHSTNFDAVDQRMRFTVAAHAPDANEDTQGVYGEMPLRGMAEILQHPAVADILSESPDHGRFVDFGSGSGRLLLGVASMLDWSSVIGIEAIESLHKIASQASNALAETDATKDGITKSIHVRSAWPHEDDAASDALEQCDVCFMYSTAFPCAEDGLRLPELSASLSCLLREGSVVVTTDKFLIGERFRFEALIPVLGDEGERIHVFIWTVVGPPHKGGYDSALDDVYGRFMDEDPCALNEAACEALLKQLALDEGDAEA